MRETESDLEIIQLVYNYRILSQAQIHHLSSEKHPSATQRRLRRLYDHKYLERLFLPITHLGASPTLYILDRQGVVTLQRHGVTDFTALPKRNLSSMFLDHTMAINDTRIAINDACQRAGWEVKQWVTENEIKADYDRVNLPDQKQSVPLIPDSYFIVRIPGKGVSHFFLELDRGTMTLKRFKTKIKAYVNYYKSGAFNKRYSAKGFRVLTVVDTPSPKRQNNLAAATTTIPGIGRRFWFAHLPDITNRNPLTDPVWRVGKDQQPTNLFSP